LVNYLAHWFYFNHNYTVYRLLDSVWVFTSLAVYPLYYYYIRLLTVDLKLDWKWGWILIPAILLSSFSAVLYLLMSPAEIDVFTHEVLYHNREYQVGYPLLVRLQSVRVFLFKVIFATEVLLTLYFGLRLIKEFNHKVHSFYSNVENREISSIRTLLFFLVLTALISFLSNVVGKHFFSDHPVLLAFPSLAHSMALFGISYVGYRQHFSIRDLCQDQQDEEECYCGVESESEAMTGMEYDLLLSKLETLFEENQIFKNPELRLNDVAQELGTNRTYLSRLIRHRRNMTFCDFVNDYRVRYAEAMLSSPEQFRQTIDEVAYNSGFSGSSSFYRAFVKKNGIPPGKFRKQV
jgi:AraC-like DNA-binding protein